jgi:hypothetical protein
LRQPAETGGRMSFSAIGPKYLGGRGGIFSIIFQKYIPKYGRVILVVGDKNVRITKRFFDSHYISSWGSGKGYQQAKAGTV